MEKIFFGGGDGPGYCGILETAGPGNGPLSVMVHGLGSSKDSSTNLALRDRLLPKGISVFRIDMFGHGESRGSFEDLTHSKGTRSVLAALEHVKGLGFERIGLVGSSFGGFSSIRAAAASDIPEFLALKSPVVTDIIKVFGVLFEDLMKDWEEVGYIEYTGMQGELRRLNYTFFQDAVRYEGYGFAADIDIPVLIVHGGSDEIVPHAQSAGLADALADCRLVTLDEADHSYTDPVHFRRMIELISDFVIEQF